MPKKGLVIERLTVIVNHGTDRLSAVRGLPISDKVCDVASLRYATYGTEARRFTWHAVGRCISRPSVQTCLCHVNDYIRVR